MAFVSGVSSALRAKEALDRCDVTVSKAAVAKRAAVVVNAGNDKRRGFNLFKDDVIGVFLEQAPQRVIGTTQNNSSSSEPQPGEYGYVDPMAKQDAKRTKAEKKKAIADAAYVYDVDRPKPISVAESAAPVEAVADVSPSPNVQPGEFGWSGYKEMEKKPVVAKVAPAAASDSFAELPDFLADQVSVDKDEYSDLPDYLKPLPEDKARSNWNY